MQRGSHYVQAARKPARPKACKVGTQLLPQKGSFSWLNFDADCRTTARAQEVPTSLFERLPHSGASTPQASGSLAQFVRRSNGD